MHATPQVAQTAIYTRIISCIYVHMHAHMFSIGLLWITCCRFDEISIFTAPLASATFQKTNSWCACVWGYWLLCAHAYTGVRTHTRMLSGTESSALLYVFSVSHAIVIKNMFLEPNQVLSIHIHTHTHTHTHTCWHSYNINTCIHTKPNAVTLHSLSVSLSHIHRRKISGAKWDTPYPPGFPPDGHTGLHDSRIRSQPARRCELRRVMLNNFTKISLVIVTDCIVP